jgi:hypothetical protein
VKEKDTQHELLKIENDQKEMIINKSNKRKRELKDEVKRLE